jgi:4-amino-4-deoxy-L-arabinose transferase-like glycosyltransferase
LRRTFQILLRHRLALETFGVFVGALAILLTFAPTAPFTKELGVCESGAVRDVLSGNIILPRFIPGPIVHVPPLYWWTAALSVRVFGWTELALRLPALIPAALTCAVVYAWTAARFPVAAIADESDEPPRQKIRRDAALWAAVSLLLCHFFIDAARQPRMDAMLAMFVTGAIAALECAIATGKAGWFVVAALAIGLGCLSKGILGLALPAATVAIYLITRRRFTALFQPALIVCFGAGLAIGLAWYVAGYDLAGRKFLQWQLGMNLWSRFIPAEAGGASYCVHPVWYFAPQIARGFLPWSLYTPALAVAIGTKRRTLSEPIYYSICWFVAIFALFSLSRGKCLVYILPAFPPLAILIGWTIAQACSSVQQSRWFVRLFRAGSLATAIGGAVAISGVLALIESTRPLPVHLHPTDLRSIEILRALSHSHNYAVVNWVTVTAIGIFIVLRGIRKRGAEFEVFGVLLIAFAGMRFWFGAMTPMMADHETLRLFAREISDVVPPGAPIGHIGIEDCDIYFYSSRPITPIFGFSCERGAAFPPYIVIRKNRLDAMPPADRDCLTPTLVSDSVDGNGPRILVEQTGAPHSGLASTRGSK